VAARAADASTVRINGGASRRLPHPQAAPAIRLCKCRCARRGPPDPETPDCCDSRCRPPLVDPAAAGDGGSDQGRDDRVAPHNASQGRIGLEVVAPTLGETYQDCLTPLAPASGIETPTRAPVGAARSEAPSIVRRLGGPVPRRPDVTRPVRRRRLRALRAAPAGPGPRTARVSAAPAIH
jgi:hypothetical protein